MAETPAGAGPTHRGCGARHSLTAFHGALGATCGARDGSRHFFRCARGTALQAPGPGASACDANSRCGDGLMWRREVVKPNLCELLGVPIALRRTHDGMIGALQVVRSLYVKRARTLLAAVE